MSPCPNSRKPSNPTGFDISRAGASRQLKSGDAERLMPPMTNDEIRMTNEAMEEIKAGGWLSRSSRLSCLSHLSCSSCPSRLSCLSPFFAVRPVPPCTAASWVLRGCASAHPIPSVSHRAKTAGEKNIGLVRSALDYVSERVYTIFFFVCDSLSKNTDLEN